MTRSHSPIPRLEAVPFSGISAPATYTRPLQSRTWAIYAFFTNNNTPSPYLYRLYFGNSLLNTPTVTNLGSFGGVIPYNTEGVQVVEDADGWHVLVVGSPMPDSKIVKVDFGASLTNPTPVAVDWGNIGNLNYPHDLFITKENNQFYGFTINAYNNTCSWDGRFKSQEQPAGTYVYVVRYAYFGKETQLLEQKGTFTLIR